MIPCSRGSHGRGSSRTDTGRTSLIDSRLSSALALTFLLNTGSVVAQELQAAQNLGEDFLNYLADMSIEDGQIIDQLDMLGLESESIQNENIQREVLETNFNQQPTKAEEINVKFKDEDFSSDEQEEQQ